MSGSQEILEVPCRPRGVALLVVLVMLLLLGALGSALLALTVVDLRIGENHETSAKLLYLAEAGIDEARALLQQSRRPASQLLAQAAGPDEMLSASSDPAVLAASDDVPLIGRRRLFPAQPAQGEYSVYLSNDAADGMTSILDANRTVRLLSIARLARSRKIVGAVVSRSGFPDLRAAITAGIFAGLDERLQHPDRTEHLVEGLVANATTVFNPAWNETALIGDTGGPDDYRVTAVNGNAQFGPGAGYGILLVRGELIVEGDFSWHGLVLVIGQGAMRWPVTAVGQISGAVFISRTRAEDRDAGNPLGSLLATPGPVTADFSGGGIVAFDTAELERAHQSLPYVVIASRERM